MDQRNAGKAASDAAALHRRDARPRWANRGAPSFKTLLAGVCRIALMAVPPLASLGVALPQGAEAATTLTGTYNATVALESYGGGNPFVFAKTFGAEATIGNGVYGDAGKAWTITNGGTIHPAGAKGIYLNNAGFTETIVNLRTGTIIDDGVGVVIKGSGRASIVNKGSIYGRTHGVSIYLNELVVGTVVNTGTIRSNSLAAIGLSGAGGTVINTGLVQSAGLGGVYILDGPGLVVNKGAAVIAGGTANGVYLRAGGGIYNRGRSAIFGGTNGAVIAGAYGTVVNLGHGTITGSTGDGVDLKGGGVVHNAGLISGTAGYGVRITTVKGTVVNLAGGAIRGDVGVYLGVGGSVDNHGLISGAYGIKVTHGAGTVTNNGTILGSGGTAIQFGNGNDLLTLKHGSYLGGNVDGGSGTDTIELKGAGTETHDFLNFEDLIVLAGTTDQWTLAGTSTIGSTDIESGRLRVTGTLQSTVTIGAHGNLGGGGTVVGNVTSHGTVSPGTGIGTLTINGNFVAAAGSHLQVDANAAGQGDELLVEGKATLKGGTVDVVAHGTNYGTQTRYTILNSTGTLSGTFGGATSNLAFLTPSLSYDAHDVLLTLTRNSTPMAAVGANANESGVGGVLDVISQGSGGGGALVGSVLGLTRGGAQVAFDQLSGELHADLSQIQVRSAQLFSDALSQQMQLVHGGEVGQAVLASFGTNRFSLGADGQAYNLTQGTGTAPPVAGAWSAWASGLGSAGGVSGQGGVHSLNYAIGSGAYGLDYRVSSRLVVGGAWGFSDGSLGAQGLAGTGVVKGQQFGAYASYAGDGWYLDGQLGYAYNNDEVKRMVSLPGLVGFADGRTHADQMMTAFEAGAPVKLSPQTVVTPYAGVQASSFHQAAFNESGAGAADLATQALTASSVRSLVGGQLAQSFDIGWKQPVAFEARLAWAHEFVPGGAALSSGFASAPGASFAVQGVDSRRDSAVVRLGLAAVIDRQTSFFLRYDGDIAGRDDSHAFSGGMKLVW